jgi:hypothetical protein
VLIIKAMVTMPAPQSWPRRVLGFIVGEFLGALPAMLFFAAPLRKLASARASPAPSPSPITNRRAAIYRGLVEADGFRLSAAADAHSMMHAPPPRRKTAVETSAMAVPSVRTLWERTREAQAGRSCAGPTAPPTT